MNNSGLKICLLIIVVATFISGCSVKKFMNEGEYLVNKYQVKVVDKPEEIKPSDLRTFFKPKPNSKILGVHWKLHNYYKFQEKESKFNKWRNKNFGEEPVMYEDDEARRIAKKMEKYLDNIGFFHSKVSFEAEFKKKSVKLSYTVQPAIPYHISEVSYDIPDSVLRQFFNARLKNTKIKTGDIYNAYTMDDERDRITKHLRDEGYYYFNRNYIQFIVDSSFSDHSLTLVLKINNVKKTVAGSPGITTEVNHTRYYIKSIEVIPDWKPLDFVVYDTVPHTIRFWEDTNTYVYNFLLDKKKRIKPSAFNSAIKIKPNQPYSSSQLQQTYRRLFNFTIIRTGTINFDTTGAGSGEDGSYDCLNARIVMQTTKLNTFQVEAEGTNSSGDLGVRGNVIYSNRNIFKRADVFTLRVNGGFEAQSVSATGEGSSGTSLFNTFQAGVSGNFYFPRFLFPGRLTRFNQRYSPVTNVGFGFSYQLRPNYSRNITNFDIGYTWKQTPQIKHIVTPININYVNITPTAYFDSIIDNEPNQRLKEQYSDHLIAGLSYSFIFNNQNLKVLEHFNYFRANFETSGNLLYGLNRLFGSEKSEAGHYRVAGVRYAQYIRFNFDYRHFYYFLEKKNSLAFRILLGFAIPYLNSTEIPYEKGYFGGGANDMRGWQFRTLGPGGYSGQNDYERVGDLQIEGSAEYRFTIYRALKGAFFLDVGNIWTWKNSDTFPNSAFEWNTWYQQLAVDGGFGVRLDFQFFIFRVDMAIPVIDPAYWETGDQVRVPIEWNRTIFNFGIGYPF